jgi:hypothetical protein
MCGYATRITRFVTNVRTSPLTRLVTNVRTRNAREHATVTIRDECAVRRRVSRDS